MQDLWMDLLSAPSHAILNVATPPQAAFCRPHLCRRDQGRAQMKANFQHAPASMAVPPDDVILPVSSWMPTLAVDASPSESWLMLVRGNQDILDALHLQIGAL